MPIHLSIRRGGLLPRAVLVVSVLFLLLQQNTHGKTIPHVQDCNFCDKCILGDSPDGASASQRSLLDTSANGPRAQSSASAGDAHHIRASRAALREMVQKLRAEFLDTSDTHHARRLQRELKVDSELRASYLPRPLVPGDFSPSKKDILRKQTLPNCTECYGCNTQLEYMHKETEFMGHTFTNERGATSSWIFRASTPKARGGHALVKVYCVPVSKTGNKVAKCGPQYVMNVFQIFLAVEKLAEECGFDEVIPKLWIDKVDAVMPDVGYHIRWYAVWMEIAEGISLENLLRMALPTPSIEAERLEDMFNDKLNKTQVYLAAVFDLLSCQCDRHAQNVMISEDGNFRLIDNEWSWQFFVNPCAMDSIFLQTTQKNQIVKLGNSMVLKQVTRENYQGWHADPQLLLDYRCWVEGGEIGKNFPPKMKQCLARIAAMTHREVEKEYSLPTNRTAFNLWQRAKDLHERGYEWTLKYGKPRNPAPKTYKLQPPCCEVRFNNKIQKWSCAHEWQPSWDLPYGDPIIGWAWKKTTPDPGTYEGGTVF